MHELLQYIIAWYVFMSNGQTHSLEGHVPDHIVSKTSVSRSDHSETSPCIIRLVQLFTPILLTFTLCVNRNLYNNCVDEMYMVGWRSCHPFTLNPIYFQSVKPGCVRCQCIIHMLLGLFRSITKRGTCVCPQRNTHASRAHSQYTHMTIILLHYLAKYSIVYTSEGSLQYCYYSMSVLTLPFSFTFVNMTITAGCTSQIICQKSETVSGVGPAGGHTHYCRLQCHS